jgi:hypothetical protein
VFNGLHNQDQAESGLQAVNVPTFEVKYDNETLELWLAR